MYSFKANSNGSSRRATPSTSLSQTIRTKEHHFYVFIVWHCPSSTMRPLSLCLSFSSFHWFYVSASISASVIGTISTSHPLSWTPNWISRISCYTKNPSLSFYQFDTLKDNFVVFKPIYTYIYIYIHTTVCHDTVPFPYMCNNCLRPVTENPSLCTLSFSPSLYWYFYHIIFLLLSSLIFKLHWDKNFLTLR